MGVIGFSDSRGGTWSVAGWAFRQLLDDVSQQYANDTELIEKFEQSKLHSGLILYLLDPSFADRIKNAISDVANGILTGTIQSGIEGQPYGDEMTAAQYLESLKELLEILRTSEDHASCLQFPSPN